MGLLQGPRLMAWTTKSPIREITVYLEVVGLILVLCNMMLKQRFFLNFTEGFLRFGLEQNILRPVKG